MLLAFGLSMDLNVQLGSGRESVAGNDDDDGTFALDDHSMPTAAGWRSGGGKVRQRERASTWMREESEV